MANKNLTLIILIHILFFQSCSFPDKKINNYEKEFTPLIIQINEEDIKNNIKMSDFINTFRLVKLETTQQSLIGGFKKIIEYKGRIYIHDRFSAKTVFVFNSNGEFLFKVGTLGKGPGEYPYPGDFTINKVAGEVYILTHGKIIHYNLEGKFQKETPLNFPALKIEYTGPDFNAFIGGGQEDKLIICDDHGRKITSYFPFDKINRMSLWNPLQSFRDSIFLFRSFLNDTIYRLEKDFIYPYRIIDFGNKAFSARHIKQLSEMQKDNIIKAPYLYDYMTRITSYYESNKFIYFTLWYKDILHLVYYSKVTKNKIVYPRKNFNNDITFTNTSPLIYSVNDEGEFIYLIQPYEIIDQLNEIKLSSNYNQWDEVKKNRFQQMLDFTEVLDETSNPILMIAKFKDF